MRGPDVAMLTALLVEERGFLRRGEFASLASLADRKEAIVRRLGPAHGPALHALRDMLEENRRLISAAMDGIQVARARLRGLADSGAGTSVYTAHGRLVTHAAAAKGVERRA